MRLIILAFSLLVAPAFAQTQADPEAATGLAPKPEVTAQHFMVVTANPLATRAGAEMISTGGTAADAAIAALLVLNVVEPQSSGIGGGAFALVHSESGITSWDARETAPQGAVPEMFMEDGDSLPFWDAVRSGRSIECPMNMTIEPVARAPIRSSMCSTPALVLIAGSACSPSTTINRPNSSPMAANCVLSDASGIVSASPSRPNVRPSGTSGVTSGCGGHPVSRHTISRALIRVFMRSLVLAVVQQANQLTNLFPGFFVVRDDVRSLVEQSDSLSDVH